MTESLRELALEAYDRVIGLQLVAVDGCITKAPGGEDTLEDLGPLPEQVSVHLDRGYDPDATRKRLEERGLNGVISEKGKPAPLAAGRRWVIERTNS